MAPPTHSKNSTSSTCFLSREESATISGYLMTYGSLRLSCPAFSGYLMIHLEPRCLVRNAGATMGRPSRLRPVALPCFLEPWFSPHRQDNTIRSRSRQFRQGRRKGRPHFVTGIFVNKISGNKV